MANRPRSSAGRGSERDQSSPRRGSAYRLLFAGLAPGEVGVYQINVTVPGWRAPGLSIPLSIKQGAGIQTSVPAKSCQLK